MKGYGNTQTARQRKRKALKVSFCRGSEKAALAASKSRKAYQQVSLPTLNLPPERGA